MQTAAIGYRVADFLKQHPPFNSIEEPDLLSLVSRGRVSGQRTEVFAPRGRRPAQRGLSWLLA